jgi:lysozyme
MTPRKTSLALMLALCAVLAATAAPASAGTKARGIDVSRFQGPIDWPTVAASGIRFAFVQAARGNGTDCSVRPEHCGGDPFYAINYANAKAVGIRVGPYHRAFASGATRAEARADAISEADVYLATVGTLVPGDLLPALDVETPFTGLTPKRLTTWVRVWLKRVRARLGVKPLIYTNASSWGATGDTREFAKARYPLWVAEWGVSKPTVPAGNWAGRGHSVWQYTSSGTVPGISGRVDLDRLRVGLAKITIR